MILDDVVLFSFSVVVWPIRGNQNMSNKTLVYKIHQLFDIMFVIYNVIYFIFFSIQNTSAS